MRPRNEALFWQKVQGSDYQDCWLWQGCLDRSGYGKFTFRRKFHTAHRFAYEAMVHKVPDGLELDHLCRTRACVNPWHLEPVTHRVNTIRSAAVLKFCPNGHPRNEANIQISPRGTKVCRPCNRARVARYKARKKGAA